MKRYLRLINQQRSNLIVMESCDQANQLQHAACLDVDRVLFASIGNERQLQPALRPLQAQAPTEQDL